MNGAKWISNFLHPKRWAFEIDEEFGFDVISRRDTVSYRLIADGDADSHSWDYLYDTFEGAQTGAELKWDVPLDSWVEVKNFEDYQLLLEELMRFRPTANFAVIIEALRTYGREVDFVKLTQDYVTSILVRYYLTHELSTKQVGDWARAVNGREDIQFCDDIVLNAVHILANAKSKLTPKIARRLLDKLSNS